MSQALYRKYRSRSLAEVVGQEHITATLEHALKAGRINHAYLFTGPRGVGKTSIARILAHQINSLPYSDTPPLDIIEIDAASNRRIDDIRDLRDKVHIAPVSAAYKVYIIDEVHMLTGESFNALLKTLEEPPAHVVFILATTEAHKLPATIISRTQRFTFRPAPRDKLIAHLREIANKEKITITDEALGIIAEHGDGSFRDSIGLLDQLAHIATGEITADEVSAMLGLAPRQQVQALADAVIAGDAPAIAAQLGTLAAQGLSASTLVHQLISMFIAAAPEHPRLYALIDRLLEVPRAYNPDLKLLTALMTAAHLSTTPAPKPDSEPKNAPALTAAPLAVTIAQAPAPKKRQPAPDNPPLQSLTPQQWHQVLDTLKKTSPPAHSVLKWAEPVLDAAANTLTLKVKYQLHRKKLDDSKQKALLADVIASTLGGSPTISTVMDANATPPPKPLADPAAASVAAIMGGGEMINAKDAQQ